MATRRQFLQGSLATTGLALASSAFINPVSSVLGTPGPHLQLHTVVYQPWLAQSAAFGAEATRLHLPTLALETDITPGWLTLTGLWRSTPAAVAGLTSLAPLLLIEQSARDHGLTVAFRAEHRAGRDGSVSHRIEGPPEVSQVFSSAIRRRRDFGACLAGAFVQCPAGSTVRHAASLDSRPAPGGTAAVPLYSWILAPRLSATASGANA